MKSNILIIIKKELHRFFSDKRMVLTALVMPGLMIYLIYTFMGNAFSGLVSPPEDFSVGVVNLPDSLPLGETILSLFGPEQVPESDIENRKEKIKNSEEDLLIVFPATFEEDISARRSPNIEIYYSSVSAASGAVYSAAVNMLDEYENSLANVFDVNKAEGGKVYDLATNEETTGFFLASMMPMLLITLLFSGCVAVSTESIAGEKERGTMATLLVTPVRRSEIAIGKIAGLAALALGCGVSSFIGLYFSLPKLMSFGGDSDLINMKIYKVWDFAALIFVLLSTACLLVSLVAIISAFAKSVKEATATVMPLMIVVVLIGLSAIFSASAKTGILWYSIPVYNSVQTINGIFSFNYSMPNTIVTIVSNFICSLIAALVLTQMFKSEKIMFSK
ncbi:MAG: ABC transporter permease [Oscillospiraceae bacterium]|jgi:sodium transport system permease protein|nr:ABC transporter permease [Oscillospiraceae bacterium]